MADRPPDDIDDLNDVEKGPADEGRILAPEELDISESEHVEELEEGRFVVSPDGPPNVGPKQRGTAESGTHSERNQQNRPREDSSERFTQQSQPQRTQQEQSQSEPRQTTPRGQHQSDSRQSQSQQPAHPQPALTEEQVHEWLRQDFEANSSKYAFDVTATFEGTVSQRRMASNDVVTIFESLVLWYAQQVDSSTPVEEILGILLMESNVPIRYPPKSIHKLVKSSNLGPEDSIGDLLEAIDDGVQL